jgi:hypothetical protein
MTENQKLRLIALCAALVSLSGCGKMSSNFATSVDGYAVRCIDGTQYILMSSDHGLAITPSVGTDGKPKGCAK